jgi:hypothetical protein
MIPQGSRDGECEYTEGRGHDYDQKVEQID